MSLVNYLEPNHTAVEESHLNRWRVFNGENWTHGFDDKKKAIKFAKKNGGTRIAFVKRLNGKTVFLNPMKIELGGK